MELKEIKNESRKMLATFIDAIGLDGEFYSQLNRTPIVYGIPKLDQLGEYISPSDERLKRFMQAKKFDEKEKNILNENGLIVINEEYRQAEPSYDLYVTVIHEMLHANRNLLAFDVFREGSNEASYTYNNGKIEQNNADYSTRDVDASQEVLKGSIDNSHTTIESYEGKTSEEIEDIDFIEGKIDAKMYKQQEVDETLVDLMATLACKLYSIKQKGKEIDIWSAIEQTKEAFAGHRFGPMCEIILKHHDFQLFNWMIDPIEYSNGDIHYDFFSNYTQNDGDLLEKLYDCFENDKDEFDLEEELSRFTKVLLEGHYSKNNSRSSGGMDR